ncbi:hypothetical protein Hanom_Chr11g01043571 [Helianthus anomalus]
MSQPYPPASVNGSLTLICKGILVIDETMVNRAGLTHWSCQEGLIPFSRRSLAGSPVG